LLGHPAQGIWAGVPQQRVTNAIQAMDRAAAAGRPITAEAALRQQGITPGQGNSRSRALAAAREEYDNNIGANATDAAKENFVARYGAGS
jgi:hypothetical protein